MTGPSPSIPRVFSRAARSQPSSTARGSRIAAWPRPARARKRATSSQQPACEGSARARPGARAPTSRPCKPAGTTHGAESSDQGRCLLGGGGSGLPLPCSPPFEMSAGPHAWRVPLAQFEPAVVGDRAAGKGLSQVALSRSPPSPAERAYHGCSSNVQRDHQLQAKS